MGKDRAWLKAVTFAVLLVGLLISFQIFYSGGFAALFKKIGLTHSPWPETATLRICTTRVSSVENLESSVRLAQEGREWVGYRPDRVQISFVEAEKWFAAHCEMAVEQLAPTMLLAIAKTPILKFSYIDGPPAELLRLSKDVYEWKGQFYRSQQIGAAVFELNMLVQPKDTPQ